MKNHLTFTEISQKYHRCWKEGDSTPILASKYYISREIGIMGLQVVLSAKKQ
jgi:hypothetical protein